MKKIGIFYATISKSTEKVAQLIANSFSSSIVELHNLMDVQDVEIMKSFDLLIVGSPTYGKGDVHYLWHEIFEEMKQFDFGKIPFAVFCLGDYVYHKETFAGAMNVMALNLKTQKLKIIGESNSVGYSFLDSPKVDEAGNFPGLIIDEKNQPELTLVRVDKWCKALRDFRT